MKKVKPGYYFFVVCVNCSEEFSFGEAPSANVEEFPKHRSIVLNCPHCRTLIHQV